MSFGMEHLQAKTQKEAVEGWFCLLLESVGRRKHMRSPMSEAYVSDGNEGGQLPFDDVRLHSMMPLKMTMPRHPTGFGFTIKGSSLVCVGKVEPVSSAETAGLAPGDYIESVNGKDVSRLSAESVAAMIKSIEYFLTLGVYQQNRGPKRYPAFEQDENHYILLWEQGAKKTSSEYVDANSRMIKRGRVDLMRTFRSQVESTVELDYDIFVRQEYQVEEAIYEEIDECLPMAPPLCSQRDDIMSPASGVSSTAVSVPSELDRGFLVPRHASNNGDCVTSNSNEISDGIDNEAFLSDTATLSCVTSNSNEMSDGVDNEAFLSDTAT